MDPLKFLPAILGLTAAMWLPDARGAGAAKPSAGSETLTLKQCISAAYGFSPALKADQFDISAAGEEIIRQRTALLPSITASIFGGVIDGYPLSFSAVTDARPDTSLGTGITRGGNSSPAPTSRAAREASPTETTSGARSSSSATSGELNRADFAPYGVQRIELQYGLFQDGSILGLNDAPAIAGARAAKQSLEWTRKLGEEKVVFDLSNAFFIAQWFQRKVARDQARVHFARQRLDIVTTLFSLQLKLRQEVELARAALAADEQTLASTKLGVRDSYAVLALLTGRSPSPVLRLDTERPKFTTLPPLEGILQLARQEHPAIGVQRSVADYALARLRLNRAALWPRATFNTSFAVGENFSEISTTNKDTPTRFATGIAVSVPLFDWGSQRAAVREARTKLLAEQTRTAQVQTDICTALARLYNEEHDLERQLTTLVTARVAAGNGTRLAREQRSVGSLGQLAVVESEVALLAAEDAEEAIRLLILEKYAGVQQAAGGAWRWVR